MNRWIARAWLAALPLLFASGTARAMFHAWDVVEVYSNASGTIQFIELRAQFGAQQFLQTFNATLTSSDGISTRTYTFPSNLPGDTANKTALLATQGFANLGIVAPDYIIPDGFVFTGNGNVKFVPNGSTLAYAPLPTDGVNSWNIGNVAATNSPKNFAGVTGTISPPMTVPGAPTIGTATDDNMQVTVSFTPPSNNGGAAITAYLVACTPNGSAQGPASPITVSGLANGVAVTCSVKARNALGDSAPSGTVSATPATTPGAPGIGAVIPGNGQVMVNFSPPGSDGGAAITQYAAACTPGGFSQPQAASPIVVSGLTNSVPVSCTVTATNRKGAGAPSASAGATPFGPPGAPLGVSAARGDGQATISFSPPATDGGSAITGYEAACTPAGGSVPSGNAPLTVTGLINGTAYQCVVRAQNAAGFGPNSAPAAVTPATTPGAPSLISLTPGDAQLLARFTPPGASGGAPINGYRFTCTSMLPDVTPPDDSGSPARITGLTNGVAYSCSVRAVNAVGAGSASNLVVETPSPLAAPALVAAVSRKTHGAQGAFDLPLDIDQALANAPSVEPRNSQGGHVVVLTFNAPVLNADTPVLTDGMNAIGTVTLSSVSGASVTLSLANVPDNRRIQLGLNVTTAGGMLSSGVALAFVTGDATGNLRVSAADISATKSRLNQMVTTPAQARLDINLDGTIGTADVTAVKARSGTTTTN